MTRRLDTYADTARLADHALREIARNGRAADRILACWRLMMRGQALAADPTAGPDAGIRRLLLLNLASCQEVELLERIARHDPEAAVRRDAVVWVWRIAPDRGAQRLRTHARCDRCGFEFMMWTGNFSARPSAGVSNLCTCCNPDCRHEWEEIS